MAPRVTEGVSLTGSGSPVPGGSAGAGFAGGAGAVAATGAVPGAPGGAVAHPVALNATDRTTDSGITGLARKAMPAPPRFAHNARNFTSASMTQVISARGGRADMTPLFLACLIALGTLAVPLAPEAQQSGEVRWIGFPGRRLASSI